MAQPLVLAVEGIAGSGKTNFLSTVRNSFLSTKYAIYVVESPLARWQNVVGTNLLKMYHTDPSRYAFCFQSWCLSTRADAFAKHLRRRIDATDYRPIVTFVERTHTSDIECFATALRAKGILAEWEMELLRTQARNMIHTLPPINGIVMMDTPVDVSVQCVNIRGREGETVAITPEFQTDVLANYRTWFRNIDTPRLYVETPPAFHHQPASYDAVVRVLNEVDYFIKRLHAESYCQHTNKCTLSDEESDGNSN